MVERPIWMTSHGMTHLRIGQFFSFRCPLVNTPQLNTQPNSTTQLPSEFSSDWITTVYRQSVHLGVKPLETHDQRFFQLNSCGNRQESQCHWVIYVLVVLQSLLVGVCSWQHDTENSTMPVSVSSISGTQILGRPPSCVHSSSPLLCFFFFFPHSAATTAAGRQTLPLPVSPNGRWPWTDYIKRSLQKPFRPTHVSFQSLNPIKTFCSWLIVKTIQFLQFQHKTYFVVDTTDNKLFFFSTHCVIHCSHGSRSPTHESSTCLSFITSGRTE
jgi:hypothetical protein